MKLLRLLGVGVGVLLAAYLIHQVGWTHIAETLGLLGWKYFVVLAFPISWILLNTAGTAAAFREKAPPVPYFRLAEIRVAGETFNSLLPSGYVGGEPLKAKLLARWMPLREATAGILIAKAAQSVALVIYAGLGLTLAHPAPGMALNGKAPWLALALLGGGIFIFTQLLARQAFTRLGKFLHWMTRLSWFDKQQDRFTALDDTLGAFYREGKSQFLVSVFWHLLGWLAGAVELLVIFRLLGSPLTWTQAWFMGALAQLASVIALFVPAGVGFYEGGHYMAAIVLGLPPSLAVSVSLIRRVREVFWDGVGIFLFWKSAKEEKV